MTKKLFISYSRKDKPIADYVAAELRGRGAAVFIDYQELIAGENFIGRLGREIQSCDNLILLLSPNSVVSKWVQAEVAWAIHCGIAIIPVEIESASMVDFFLLINKEKVDFTRWAIDGQVDDAIKKLARALSLPETFTKPEQQPHIVTSGGQSNEVADDNRETSFSPTFSFDDLTQLFYTALEIAEDDPEQALFLYRRILETEITFMKGQAQEFVEKEEIRLKPRRISLMISQAETALQIGKWNQAARIAHDIQELDLQNEDAERIIKLSEANLQCEPAYEQALNASNTGRRKACIALMRSIRQTCPDYDDPARLLSGQPIEADVADMVHELAILDDQRSDDVSTLAFSPISTGSQLLAVGRKEGAVKVWDVLTRQLIATIQARYPYHGGFVECLAFNQTGTLLAIAGRFEGVEIWEFPSLNLRHILRHEESQEGVYATAFSSDGSYIFTSSRYKVIAWNTQSGEKLFQLEGDYFGWPHVFSSNGNLLAIEYDHGEIHIYNLATKQVERTIQSHSSFLSILQFSPDGTLLASAAGDRKIDTAVSLWEVQTGRHVGSIPGKYTVYESVAFNPVSSLVACSHIHDIFLWDLQKEQEVAVLEGSDDVGWVNRVMFSVDGSILASGTKQISYRPRYPSVRLWGL